MRIIVIQKLLKGNPTVLEDMSLVYPPVLLQHIFPYCYNAHMSGRISMQETYANIDEYIATFPSDIQTILKKVRRTIKNAAPKAGEKIAYGMPTFTLNGNLVHFAAFTHHIGFYPTPSAIKKFEKKLSTYKTSKGAIQFPINKPIPYDLIEQIVLFRVKESK